MFQPNLTDIFTDYIDDRTGPALDAIAQSKTDILCLSELYSPDIQQKLKGKIPDNVTRFFSLTTIPFRARAI